MNTYHKFVIIPVEIKVREFDSRLLLALFLKNFKVIFGSQNSIISNIKYLPPSIFFDKSLSINKLSFYKNLISRGFKIVSIDEEGLSSYNNTYKYISQRISSDCLNIAEKVFTWGDSEKNIILSSYPEFNNKIIATGNIRIDLNKSIYPKYYKELVFKLTNQYKRYFLFPSSFSVNHALGFNKQMKNLKKLGRIKTKDDSINYKLKHDFFSKTFIKYSNLVETIADTYPNIAMIVRPHPAEDKSHWINVSNKHNNLHIRTDYSIAPWILGSSIVIHSSCTTGLEAFILGKPVISYLPYIDHEYVKHIANDVSVQCRSVSDVLDQLKDGNFDLSKVDEKYQILEYHLANLKNEPAYKRIVEELYKIDIDSHNFNVLNIPVWKSFYIFTRKLKLKKFHNNDNGYLQYSKQKFPGSTLEEVITMIQKYQQILPELKTKDYKVKQLHRDLYLIG